MRVRITITDDQGRTFAGDTDLQPLGQKLTKSERPAKKVPQRAAGAPVTPVFSLNPRAFMKKYGSNGTGAQKFTLLLARLASGDPSREVTFETIKGQWNKMKGIIGKFNPAYSLRARDEDWVETKKQGVYVLKPSWKNAIPESN
jgi:hypothetical protein